MLLTVHFYVRITFQKKRYLGDIMGNYKDLEAITNSISGGSKKNLVTLMKHFGFETSGETAAKIIRQETGCSEGNELDSLVEAAGKNGKFSPMGLLSRYTSNVYLKYYS